MKPDSSKIAYFYMCMNLRKPPVINLEELILMKEYIEKNPNDSDVSDETKLKLKTLLSYYYNITWREEDYE